MKQSHFVIAHFLIFFALYSPYISFFNFNLCIILSSLMNNTSSQTSKFGSSLASAPTKQSIFKTTVLTDSPTGPDATTVFPLAIQIFTACHSSTSKTEAVGFSEMYPSSTLYSATSKKTVTLNYGALQEERILHDTL